MFPRNRITSTPWRSARPDDPHIRPRPRSLRPTARRAGHAVLAWLAIVIPAIVIGIVVVELILAGHYLKPDPTPIPVSGRAVVRLMRTLPTSLPAPVQTTRRAGHPTHQGVTSSAGQTRPGCARTTTVAQMPHPPAAAPTHLSLPRTALRVGRHPLEPNRA